MLLLESGFFFCVCVIAAFQLLVCTIRKAARKVTNLMYCGVSRVFCRESASRIGCIDTWIPRVCGTA